MKRKVKNWKGKTSHAQNVALECSWQSTATDGIVELANMLNLFLINNYSLPNF